MPFVTYQNDTEQSLRLLHVDNGWEHPLTLTIDEIGENLEKLKYIYDVKK